MQWVRHQETWFWSWYQRLDSSPTIPLISIDTASASPSMKSERAALGRRCRKAVPIRTRSGCVAWVGPCTMDSPSLPQERALSKGLHGLCEFLLHYLKGREKKLSPCFCRQISLKGIIRLIDKKRVRTVNKR